MQLSGKYTGAGRKTGGFTLVELAVSLTIIGILIGGVLKGVEIVNNSRVTKTIAQIKSYETATRNFLNIYGALPGDIKAPEAKLPNCTSTECTASGNGDKKICTEDCPGFAQVPNLNTSFDIGTEPIAYWRHLVAADLIIPFEFFETLTAAEQQASPYRDSTYAYGPPVTLGGRFMPLFFNAPPMPATATTPAYPAVRGHYLSLYGLSHLSNMTGMRIRHVMQIDLKMDDGVPNKGILMAANGSCYTVDSASGQMIYALEGRPDEKICPFVVSIEN